MTLHLTWWWLWAPLLALYVVGVAAGLLSTMLADDLEWWERPVMLVWPLYLAAIFLWRLALFMTGKE